MKQTALVKSVLLGDTDHTLCGVVTLRTFGKGLACKDYDIPMTNDAAAEFRPDDEVEIEIRKINK